MKEEWYMQRCLQLARMGAGRVAPNPMVGAVLVYQNEIIGEGYHEQFGKAHAEVNCLQSVSEDKRPLIPESTLYVSLEPCAHYGKTPPCSLLIIEHKIRKVVIGCRDTNTEVNGRGISQLREAGVEVQLGVLEEDCRELNKRFFTFQEQRRPYIILKWAQTLQGYLGKRGERTVISNAYTQNKVHQWRSEEAAILVGYRTALEDDPALTNRLWSGENPLRIVIDRKRALPKTHQVLDGAVPTIIVNEEFAGTVNGIEYMQIDFKILLPVLLQKLFQRGILSVLVEGGAITHRHFLDGSLWDECRIITNEQKMITKGVRAPYLPAAKMIRQERVQDDLISYFVPEKEGKA